VRRAGGIGQAIGIGQAAIRVLGHGAGHGQRPVRQLVEHRRRPVGGRHHRLAPADEHAQPQLLAFGTFQFLDLAQALRVRQRDRIGEHRVGGVRALRLGAADQVVEQAEDVGGREGRGVGHKRLGLVAGREAIALPTARVSPQAVGVATLPQLDRSMSAGKRPGAVGLAQRPRHRAASSPPSQGRTENGRRQAGH
jgi:hypothetical protein